MLPVGERRMRIQNRWRPWRQSVFEGGLLRAFLVPSINQGYRPKRNQVTKASQKSVLRWAKVLGRFSEQQKRESGPQKLRICGYRKDRKQRKEALEGETWKTGNTTQGLTGRPPPALPDLLTGYTSGEQCVEFGDCHVLCWCGRCCVFGWNESRFHSGEMRKHKAKEIGKEGSSKFSMTFS